MTGIDTNFVSGAYRRGFGPGFGRGRYWGGGGRGRGGYGMDMSAYPSLCATPGQKIRSGGRGRGLGTGRGRGPMGVPAGFKG